MPDDAVEKRSSSPAAATPASAQPAPDKPRTASDHRKSSKPVMEKRRRARINESLAQLKALILDALKKDSSRHSKLEKADILEMTVRHLRGLQRAQLTAALNADPSVLGKYRAGFGECMNEVTRFLSTCDGVTAEVRTRLLGHLAGCMSQLGALHYAAPPQGQPPAGAPAPAMIPPAAADGAKVYGGFQLLPAPEGHFAFLVPSAAFPAPGRALLPVYAGGGLGSGLPPAAVSPGPGAPAVPALDSVWRPW